MEQNEIKSGPVVVREFVDSLAGRAEIDEDTLRAVKELLQAGKLSKAQLLRRLEENREPTTKPPASQSTEQVR